MEREAGSGATLVRFVSTEGQLRLDLSGNEGGRGVYCHLRPGCLKNPKLSRILASGMERGSRNRNRAKVAPGAGETVSGAAVSKPIRCADLSELIAEARSRLEQPGVKGRAKALLTLDAVESMCAAERKGGSSAPSTKREDHSRREMKKRIRL